MDTPNYLDPETIGGVDLYAYCNNNPVMYVDPMGHIPEWLGWILSSAAVISGIVLCATGVGGIWGGVLIGAGVNSLINGYINKANGGSFTAGYIGGAISSALCAIGAGYGGVALTMMSKATDFVALGYFFIAMGVSYAGGASGSIIGVVTTSWIDSNFESINVDWREAVSMAMIMGYLNILAAYGAKYSSEVASLGKFIQIPEIQSLCRVIAGSVAGLTEALYDLFTYLFGLIF